MADEIRVRECREDEGQAVLDLWSQAGDVLASSTDTLDEILAAIKHSRRFVLGGGLWRPYRGHYHRDGWRGEVYRLAVSPEVRRQGVARMKRCRGSQSKAPRWGTGVLDKI